MQTMRIHHLILTPCHKVHAAVLITFLCAIFLGTGAATDYRLRYTAPATDWKSQCLPIGNGSIGGMIFGGVATEQIQFNEITLWTGGTTTEGTGNYLGFGGLFIDMIHPAGTPSNYRRDLDIGEALAHVSYAVGSMVYNREYFASFPDSVLVGHITGSVAGGCSDDRFRKKTLMLRKTRGFITESLLWKQEKDDRLMLLTFAVIDVEKGQDKGNDNHNSKIIVVPFAMVLSSRVSLP
jgi:hypothetical protein